MRQIITLLLCSICLLTNAQNNLSFKSIDEVFSYADSHSSTFKNATQQSILAKYQTLAAQLSKWNLKGDANFSAVDNTKLPVSFIPAEIFGGPEGTFKQITFGQQYVSNLTIAPQIDLLNPYAAALVKVSKANEKLTAVTNQLTKKSLYESIAAAYYNILSYQWQIKVTKNSLANADTLTLIMQNKQKEGVARSQDVNNAIANQLTTQDKLQQLELLLLQQYNSLKILCDIDVASVVTINNSDTVAPLFQADLSATGNLEQQQNDWQHRYQQASLSAGKKWFYPTVSLFGGTAWQQNNNNHFFDNSKWFASNYVGMRLILPIVPDATKIATVKYDRINAIVAENNFHHAALQDSINNDQLKLDYQKAFKSYQLAAQIERLKKDSYQKNLDIYKEGILSATDLFISFNDWLSSSLNTASQLANSEYNKSKIIINNTLK